MSVAVIFYFHIVKQQLVCRYALQQRADKNEQAFPLLYNTSRFINVSWRHNTIQKQYG